MQESAQGKTAPPGLDIEVDMALQEREWKLQRLAWAVFYGLLLAIICGLLGRGPLSEAAVGASQDPLRMSYERFLRHRTSDTLHMTLQAQGDTVRLAMDRDYVRHAGMQSITPQPLRTLSADSSLIFVFAATPGVPVKVDMEIQAQHVGRLDGWVALADQPPLRFSQFVYP